MMLKRVVLQEGSSYREKCTGCRMCEVICSFRDGVVNPRRSRIRVIRASDGDELPTVCYQCGRPKCAEACPTGAIVRGLETIKIITQKCTGCALCVAACPFGAIHIDPTGLAIACDLCGGLPRCVDQCPTRVLKLQTIDTESLSRNKALGYRERGRRA